MVDQTTVDTGKLNKIIEETEAQISLINQIPETVKQFQAVTEAFSDALDAQKTYKSHLDLIISNVNDQRKQSEKQFSEFSNELYSLVQKIRGENNTNIQLLERHQQQLEEKLLQNQTSESEKHQEQMNQFQAELTQALEKGLDAIKHQTDNIIYLHQENHKAVLAQLEAQAKANKKRAGWTIFWILFAALGLAGYMVYMDFFF